MLVLEEACGKNQMGQQQSLSDPAVTCVFALEEERLIFRAARCGFCQRTKIENPPRFRR